MGEARTYASAVLWRGRVPMEPADFVPNWGDRPRKDKYYPDAPHFPLPDCPPDPPGGVGRGLFGPAGQDGFTLELLGGMLKDSYGLTGRRLAVQANSDLGTLPRYPHANFSRGTASGGGLYPIGIHWVSGASGPLTPGVHHYSTPHHAMRRLLTGDVTPELRAALGEPARDCDQFLVLTVKFWQNAFKYNSFAYHVVTMDIGALLETWRIWAGARGLHLGAALWFDEERIGRLFGLSPEQEGVFAVVPLRWSPSSSSSSSSSSSEPVSPSVAETAPTGARIRAVDQERSRTVSTFDTVRRVHEATLRDADRPPAPGVLDAALRTAWDRLRTAAATAVASDTPPGAPAPRLVPLPAPQEPELGVRDALRSRRSSFGRFTGRPPMTAAQLSAALAAADSAGHLAHCQEGPAEQSLTRLHVFVNHVEGVPAGAYAYEPAERALRPVRPGPQGAFLQRNYFLDNYNLEQAGAVFVITAPTPAVLDALGDRALRLVNAAVGAGSQALYTAAPAVGLSCGVALGFDSVSYTEHLGLADGEELPLLIMMIGQEHRSPADFDHAIA
ncbi:nitroreductase family protein [Kitasatospora sp. NA04385]|uniref:nitroreductase family protein n=1 Tax=Kitasatospora sp. NA04385 TaxID=2742135 RepID=UPI0015914232|nr:nitroreductase family protein [Kitasatospora sp. NA04385]QKW24056.1 nitroreductase family protein [Kitasatospora sp. NA04385]